MERINNSLINANIKLIDENKELKKEIERLSNIIKEVREKIENTTINCEGKAEDLLDDIYEILDKENNNEIK